MTINADPIMSAVENLERALTETPDGRAEMWAAEVDRALSDIRRSVKERDAELKTRGGQLVDVDRPLLPSPTMDRHVNDLRHELDGVLEEVASLRLQARNGNPELGAFRQRAQRLLTILRSFEQQEGALIQEAVNTDIGGGD